MTKGEKSLLAREGYVFVEYGNWDVARAHQLMGDKVCILVKPGTVVRPAPILLGCSRHENGMTGAIVRVTGKETFRTESNDAFEAMGGSLRL